MSLIDNLIVVGILIWIGYMVYSRMDKDKISNFWSKIEGLFGGK